MKNLILLLSLCCFSTLFAQSEETWTSSNGHSFKGTFIRMDGQNVTLRGTDGKEVTVPLTALDEASKQLAQKEHQLAIKNAPVFSHQNRFLRYSIYPKNNWMKIEFLDGNSVVNNTTYDVNFSFAEVRPHNRWTGIGIKEMIGTPEKNRTDIRMDLLMQNGVKIRFTVEVNDKAEVEYSFEITERPDDLPRLDLRTHVTFPTLLDYDINSKSYTGELSSSGVMFADLPGFLEGYEIHVDRRDGKNLKVPYHEKQTQGYGGGGFTVKQPGKKDLIFEAPKDSQDGTLYIWFYNGKSPFQGYSIRALAPGGDETREAGPFTISVR